MTKNGGGDHFMVGGTAANGVARVTADDDVTGAGDVIVDDDAGTGTEEKYGVAVAEGGGVGVHKKTVARHVTRHKP